MSLADLFMQLKIQAERTGTDRRLDLKGGARLAVRVQDGVTTLTISRKAKKVGATELETFRRDCAIPAYASRWPHEQQTTRTDEQGELWWYVAYRWRERDNEAA